MMLPLTQLEFLLLLRERRVRWITAALCVLMAMTFSISFEEATRTAEPHVDIISGLRWSAWTCLYLAALVTLFGVAASRRLREWPL